VAIPVALEAFCGVILAFEAEKFGKLGVAGFNLPAGGVFVIGQKVAAAAPDGRINQATKGLSRVFNVLGCMHGMQVKNSASVRLFGPG